MRNRILDIQPYSGKTNYGDIAFSGRMRNEKVFQLNQIVFILHANKMYQCKIVGIELPPISNPNYTYRIELPKEFIQPELTEEERELFGEEYIEKEMQGRISRRCDYIFESIEEAKESALKQLDIQYKLNKEHVERFFKEYEK